MKRKNMLYGILLLAAVVLLVFISYKFYQHSQNAKILAEVDKINFEGIEKQVVEKISQLKERVRTDPGYAFNWGRLGMNLYIHNYKQESLPVFKKAVKLDPKDFRWGYFLAITMDDLGSAEALDWLERSQPLNPDYPPLAIKLGNRYLMNGELEKSRIQFKNVTTSDHKVPHAHLGLAKIALREDNLTDAQNQLQIALQLAPEYREAHALLADIYRRTADTARAEEEFKLMNKLPVRLDLADPVYSEMEAEGVSSFWCQVRANNYLNAGQLDDAEREFKKAVEAKPNEVSYTSLGYVYQRKKQYDQALEQYQSALKLNPNYVSALNNSAVIYFETGKTAEAIELVKQALKIDPESVDSYLNLGTFLNQSGRRAEAITTFKQGLELAPDDSRFPYQLAWLLAASPEPKLRDGKEALRLVELIRTPAQLNNPVYLDLWAAALAETRQYPQAYETASRAYVLALLQKKQELAGEIEARQKLYQTQKPYRIQ
jgi:tetratricopeptide (TPR) repeat protein